MKDIKDIINEKLDERIDYLIFQALGKENKLKIKEVNQVIKEESIRKRGRPRKYPNDWTM